MKLYPVVPALLALTLVVTGCARAPEERGAEPATQTADVAATPREDVELVSYKFDYKGRATLQAKGYYALLTGIVKNNSEKAFASVRLKFDVYDDAGNRLGTVTPYSRVGPPAITSLDPGETWSFSFEISGYGGRGRSAKFLGMEATE